MDKQSLSLPILENRSVKRKYDFRDRPTVKTSRKRDATFSAPALSSSSRIRKKKKESSGAAFLTHVHADPRSLLPIEVWRMVLSNLDYADLAKCQQVCRLWNALLAPTQCDWMFSLVIPFVFEYLEQKDVLNCRLVSKTWTNAIDKFIEENTELRPYNFESHQQDNHRSCGWSPFGYTRLDDGHFFLDCFHIEHFLNEAQIHASSGRNPFVGRYVVFGVSEEDEHITQYWDSALKLIRTFGHHIWYINIGDDSGRLTPTSFYKLMWECLSNLPNLRMIEVEGYLDGNFSLLELSETVCSLKLPELGKLETIEVRLENAPPLIQGLMLECYAKQLKKIAVMYDACCRDAASFPYGLNNLSEMFIKRVDSNRALSKMNRINSPLQKLTLDLRSDAWSGEDFRNLYWDVRRLMKTVNGFPLRFLKIYLDPLAQIGPIRKPARNCPSIVISTLQTLEIENSPNVSYNFLLRMPNLEFLHISESLWRPEISNEFQIRYANSEAVEVHKFLYSAQMYQSNVWSHLPKLKIFSYNSYDTVRYVCTRDEFERTLK